MTEIRERKASRTAMVLGWHSRTDVEVNKSSWEIDDLRPTPDSSQFGLSPRVTCITTPQVTTADYHTAVSWPSTNLCPDNCLRYAIFPCLSHSCLSVSAFPFSLFVSFLSVCLSFPIYLVRLILAVSLSVSVLPYYYPSILTLDVSQNLSQPQNLKS